MRALLLGVLLVVALTLQATIFDFIRLFGVKPNLVLLMVVCYGFIHGSRPGAFLGFLGGLLTDLITGHYIGLNALANMAAGYAVGMGETSFYNENILIASGVSFIGTVVGQMVYYLLLLIIGIKISLGVALGQLILPVAVYNVILTPFLYGRFYKSNTQGLLRVTEL